MQLPDSQMGPVGSSVRGSRDLLVPTSSLGAVLRLPFLRPIYDSSGYDSLCLMSVQWGNKDG